MCEQPVPAECILQRGADGFGQGLAKVRANYVEYRSQPTCNCTGPVSAHGGNDKVCAGLTADFFNLILVSVMKRIIFGNDASGFDLIHVEMSLLLNVEAGIICFQLRQAGRMQRKD